MLARAGSWVGASSAGAIANGRWWFYQDFAAGSGPGITLTDNENGSGGASWSSANVVNNSAVVTDTDGNPVYTSATPTDSNRVTVSSHTGASVTLSAAPHASYGSVRIWYLYTQSTGSLPEDMQVAPQLVQQERAQWLDTNFLNQNNNLSDLPNAGTARTNLGFSSQTAGQVLYGNGDSTFTSESNLFWDSSNDRLGLATNSPQNRLHLNDSGANALALQVTNSVTGATSSDGLLLGLDSSGNALINQRDNLPIIVSTNNAEVARFLASGELLLKIGLQLEDTDGGTNKITLQAPSSLSGDYTLTLPTTDGGSGEVLTTDGSGNLSWGSNGGSVLTTKGDLFTYSTANDRLPVGATYGQVLSVDSGESTGIKWGPALRAGSASISSGATTKAITLTNAMPNTNYTVVAYLANYTDNPVQRQIATPIVKTTGGFTVEWENQTDSSNHVLEWIIMGHQA